MGAGACCGYGMEEERAKAAVFCLLELGGITRPPPPISSLLSTSHEPLHKLVTFFYPIQMDVIGGCCEWLTLIG